MKELSLKKMKRAVLFRKFCVLVIIVWTGARIFIILEYKFIGNAEHLEHWEIGWERKNVKVFCFSKTGWTIFVSIFLKLFRSNRLYPCTVLVGICSGANRLDPNHAKEFLKTTLDEHAGPWVVCFRFVNDSNLELLMIPFESTTMTTMT